MYQSLCADSGLAAVLYLNHKKIKMISSIVRPWYVGGPREHMRQSSCAQNMHSIHHSCTQYSKKAQHRRASTSLKTQQIIQKQQQSAMQCIAQHTIKTTTKGEQIVAK